MSDESSPREGRRNRLANETSPYLLQHADNPVDWYPWGDEAFERARTEDRPILLSVGYSSCHWCHVMAHESFEDPEIAALMNQWFVNVKVDREERPDVDSVYMTVTQAMTGQGGWPMTVFITPDEHRPIFAGTYFPAKDGYGRPGFPRVLQSIHEAWTTDRAKVLESAEHIAERLREATEREGRGRGQVSDELAMRAVARFRGAFDGEWGGFGGAPKFPSPGNLEFLLMYHHRTGTDGPADEAEPSPLSMVEHTLRRMATGGMYDHLGGGFARYSVDREWLVPHFEKMLYDNAQLVRAYLHAHQVTSDPDLRRDFERVVRETLAYLERDMLDEAGGFYSAQDADSEGIEGKFFVWTPGEVNAVLGEADSALFSAAYGVTESGNFEDPHHPEFGRRTVLNRHRLAPEVAAELGVSVDDLESRLAELRPRMLAAREERVWPGLDDKVLASWNGLALAAFAEAGRILGDAHYVEIARRNADFVRSAMWTDGRLLHTYKGGEARVDGMLEDYAYYGLGLLELARATGDLAHLRWAEQLLDVLLARFRDPEHGSFFDTAEDAERLLLRQKPFFDSATPSGNGSAGLLAFWIGRTLGRGDLEQIALEAVGQVEDQLMEAVTGFGTVWQLVELLLAPPREVAIVGTPEARAPLEREVARRFLPATVLVTADPGGSSFEDVPLLEGRTQAEGAPGGAAAYVCENLACELPTSDAATLASQLDARGHTGERTARD